LSLVKLPLPLVLGLGIVLTQAKLSPGGPQDPQRPASSDPSRGQEPRSAPEQGPKPESDLYPASLSYGGDTGLFHVSSAYTLPGKKVSFEFFRDELHRSPKDLKISILSLAVAYGATPRFELFGTVGTQIQVDARLLSQPGFFGEYPFALTPSQKGLGDVRLGAKYKFLDDTWGDDIALALRGYVKIPTANSDVGLGTGKISVGLDLLVSKTLGSAMAVHLLGGFQYNDKPLGTPFNGVPQPLEIGSEEKWGVGLDGPTRGPFQLQLELSGTSVWPRLRSRGVVFRQKSPVDLVVGPAVFLKPGLFLRPAFAANLNFVGQGYFPSFSRHSGWVLSVGFRPFNRSGRAAP